MSNFVEVMNALQQKVFDGDINIDDFDIDEEDLWAEFDHSDSGNWVYIEQNCDDENFLICVNDEPPEVVEPTLDAVIAKLSSLSNSEGG